MSALTPAPAAGPGLPGRRADYGTVRLTGRDIAGLTWVADMYGAPYDLLAALDRPHGQAQPDEPPDRQKRAPTNTEDSVKIMESAFRHSHLPRLSA
jgi:hypothetical protein